MFEVDDAEQPWTFPENHFDYIHTRIMIGCLHNWDKFYEQAFKHLKPGAWLESQEMSLDPLSATPLPADSAVKKWCDTCEDGMQKIGLSLKLRSLEEQKENGGIGYDLRAKLSTRIPHPHRHLAHRSQSARSGHLSARRHASWSAWLDYRALFQGAGLDGGGGAGVFGGR
ncbi:uncharacterized protein KY384_005633 [Bacidia gigantensis]|uniref:uncharacterized protein n=1 Tax=Bacidia gigantensis TaxID=2732470 RepID=UPI001D03A36D|nr:uncharacterized protein KY384_005633 [Bacidia gigantensis]KAG8530150.1 hypothetical protein KY384_005633 [Bacidia gigantensis]